MELFNTYFRELWILTAEMAPYLLFGLAIAGFLHVYVRQETIQKYLGKRTFKSVLYAALIGVPLPLCSCGVIPTGIGFRREGASKGATVSFLISTPQTGVDSILVTYSMMGWPFALLRPVIALITGVAGGLATNAADGSGEEVSEVHETAQSCCSDDSCCTPQSKGSSKLLSALRYAFIEFLEDIGSWLFLGLAIAAVMSVAIPDSFFEGYFGYSIVSMLIILAASVPLYVCATGSVPIAAMLLMKGLSPGTALVFLMAGPATNAATITVLSNTLGKKSTIIYVTTIIAGALGFGLFIDMALPAAWFILRDSGVAHVHEHGLEWWKIGSAMVLTGLLIYTVGGKYARKYLTAAQKVPAFEEKQPATSSGTSQPVAFSVPIDFAGIGLLQEKVISIGGMTCNHCKNSVEKNLSTLPGISSVSVDLAQNTATISGQNINTDQVRDMVNSLGYVYKG